MARCLSLGGLVCPLNYCKCLLRHRCIGGGFVRRAVVHLRGWIYLSEPRLQPISCYTCPVNLAGLPVARRPTKILYLPGGPPVIIGL